MIAHDTFWLAGFEDGLADCVARTNDLNPQQTFAYLKGFYAGKRARQYA